MTMAYIEDGRWHIFLCWFTSYRCPNMIMYIYIEYTHIYIYLSFIYIYIQKFEQLQLIRQSQRVVSPWRVATPGLELGHPWNRSGLRALKLPGFRRVWLNFATIYRIYRQKKSAHRVYRIVDLSFIFIFKSYLYQYQCSPSSSPDSTQIMHRRKRYSAGHDAYGLWCEECLRMHRGIQRSGWHMLTCLDIWIFFWINPIGSKI